MLTRPPAELTADHAVAATGVYLPPTNGLPAVALKISTPDGSASDAYYQDLLGIAVSILTSRTTSLTAYSDCSSAITRAYQSLSLMGPAVGHLQHGSLLLGIRALTSLSSLPVMLTWTPSHPERKKKQPTWTENNWGIHMADAIAGPSPLVSTPDLLVYHCDSEEVHAALTPPGTWHWKENSKPFHGSLAKRAQRRQFLQYMQKRDMKRIYANEPTR
jgi:hypothetical protein